MSKMGNDAKLFHPASELDVPDEVALKGADAPIVPVNCPSCAERKRLQDRVAELEADRDNYRAVATDNKDWFDAALERAEAAEAKLDDEKRAHDALARLYREERELTAEQNAKLEAVLGLLKVARCPDQNCDSKGTTWLGNHEMEDGSVEPELHPCQWCHERDAALIPQKPEDAG